MRCRWQWRRQWEGADEVLQWNDEILHVRGDDVNALEGYYQCFVWNTLGKVVSNKTLVRVARLARKREYDQPRSYRARVGENLRIPCDIDNKGFPPPTVDDIGWERDGIDIQQDQRLHFTETGRLSPCCFHRISAVISPLLVSEFIVVNFSVVLRDKLTD